MRWLDPATAAVVTLGAYLGMALVNWSARPSYIRIQPNQQTALSSMLEGLHYNYVQGRDHWVPPLPRWLRWKLNYVKFCPEGATIRVIGPANILGHLAAQLS